jgi:hypothetical protein
MNTKNFNSLVESVQQMQAIRRGRVPTLVTADDQLGPIVAVAAYMKVGRTWMFALKKCATRRHEKENLTPFRGGKTCKKWVMEWLERNPDFQAVKEYRG